MSESATKLTNQRADCLTGHFVAEKTVSDKLMKALRMGSCLENMFYALKFLLLCLENNRLLKIDTYFYTMKYMVIKSEIDQYCFRIKWLINIIIY